MFFKLSLALGVWALSAAFALPETAVADPMQAPKTFKQKVTRTLSADYLLFLPQGYQAKGSKRWPLLLFLHGAGERGSDLQRVKVHGPPKIVKSHPDFPFILVSPQCPEGQVWSDEVELTVHPEAQHDSWTEAYDNPRLYEWFLKHQRASATARK